MFHNAISDQLIGLFGAHFYSALTSLTNWLDCLSLHRQLRLGEPDGNFSSSSPSATTTRLHETVISTQGSEAHPLRKREVLFLRFKCQSSLEVGCYASSAPIKETATCGKPAACRSTSRIRLHHPISTRHHPSAALISPHRRLAWSSLSTRHYVTTHGDAL